MHCVLPRWIALKSKEFWCLFWPCSVTAVVVSLMNVKNWFASAFLRCNFARIYQRNWKSVSKVSVVQLEFKMLFGVWKIFWHRNIVKKGFVTWSGMNIELRLSVRTVCLIDIRSSFVLRSTWMKFQKLQKGNNVKIRKPQKKNWLIIIRKCLTNTKATVNVGNTVKRKEKKLCSLLRGRFWNGNIERIWKQSRKKW